MLEQAMGTEAFAQALGKQLEQWLSVQGPAKKAADQATEATLSALGVPSRAQVVGIARQLEDLDDRIEGLEDRLGEVVSRVERDVADLTELFQPPVARHRKSSYLCRRCYVPFFQAASYSPTGGPGEQFTSAGVLIMCATGTHGGSPWCLALTQAQTAAAAQSINTTSTIVCMGRRTLAESYGRPAPPLSSLHSSLELPGPARAPSPVGRRREWVDSGTAGLIQWGDLP